MKFLFGGLYKNGRDFSHCLGTWGGSPGLCIVFADELLIIQIRFYLKFCIILLKTSFCFALSSSLWNLNKDNLGFVHKFSPLGIYFSGAWKSPGVLWSPGAKGKMGPWPLPRAETTSRLILQVFTNPHLETGWLSSPVHSLRYRLLKQIRLPPLRRITTISSIMRSLDVFSNFHLSCGGDGIQFVLSVLYLRQRNFQHSRSLCL